MGYVPRVSVGVEFRLVDDPVQSPGLKKAVGGGDIATGLAVLELLASDPATGGTAPQAAKIRRPRRGTGAKRCALITKRGLLPHGYKGIPLVNSLVNR